MKLSVLLVLVSSLQFLAIRTYSQEAKLTLDLKDVTVEEVLDKIEQQSEFFFLYSSKMIDVNRKVDINLEENSIDYALTQLFTGTDVDYVVSDRQIVLSTREQIGSLVEEIAIQVQQEIQVSGIVTDEHGEPLPGVSIRIQGTSIGTISDRVSRFEISVPDQEAVLVFSYIGFLSRVVVVGSQTTINVALAEDVVSLDEVIVTALGIDREKDGLGFSFTEITEISNTGVYNVANTLSGKVTGVMVSQVASGAGGSSKVIIRGNNSLMGNSQPLYVIDGIPMNSETFGMAQWRGGTDYGDGLTSLNQDDIEAITILKGPNAASLYGQRGSNGVILITTKTGKAQKGIGVTLNSTFSVGDAAILPDFQNEYGQGFSGEYTHLRAVDGTIYGWQDALDHGISGVPKMSAGRNRLTRGSWGRAYDGQMHEDQFGNLNPYVAQPNTFQDYFEKQLNLKNTLILSGGSEDVNYYFSFSDLRVDGHVPANTVNRNTFNLRSVAKITAKLLADIKINYSIEENENRPLLSDGVNNPVYLLLSQPRSMYASALQDHTWDAEQLETALGYGNRAVPGNEKTYATNGSTANQYWTIDNIFNSDRRDRILASLNLKYDFTDFLSLSMRGGTDMFTDQRYQHRAIGTRRTSRQQGDIFETVNRVREDNLDVLLSSKFDPTDGFNIQINAGVSHAGRYFRQTGYNGYEFQIPDLYTVTNTLTQNTILDHSECVIHSVYAAAQVGLRNFLYLDLTGRNDWSSTLPLDDNSFFYPSVSLSFVLTEAMDLSNQSVLNYLKFRGSYAQAGNSGAPYQLYGAYSLGTNPYGTRPMGYFSSTIPDPNLKNEVTTSVEFGADAKFFGNRLGIEATYYSSTTENQILTVPMSRATNYTSMRINAGEISNKGFELLLKVIPVQTDNGFVWESSFNFAKNVNEVVSLAEGVETFILGVDRNVNIVAAPGEPFGQIYGTSFSWQKDADGNRLIDPVTGLPLRSDGKHFHHIGSALPDWISGLYNSFSYKGLSLNLLIDIHQGGQIFSQTTREIILYGTTTKTLQGRDGTYVAEGVMAELDGDGNWIGTGVENTMQVQAQDYWNVVASTKDNVVSEEMLNDASYMSMREVTFSYQLSSKLVSRTPLHDVRIGLFGRNLFYFERHTDGFAPEASAFNVLNSGLGLESTSLPLMRTFGVNLTIGL